MMMLWQFAVRWRATVCLCLVALTLVVGYSRFSSSSWDFVRDKFSRLAHGTPLADGTNGATLPVAGTKPSSLSGGTSPPADPATYVQAILHPELPTTLERLDCPLPMLSRYERLRPAASEKKLRYLFALDLRQVAPLLPRLLGTVVAVAQFLGVEHCGLSIVEGNSNDGTAEILKALDGPLKELGLRYRLVHSELDPSKGERIERLAALRNEALKPLLRHTDANGSSEGTAEMGGSSDVNWDFDATNSIVVFLNDVAACPDDVLELLHQRDFQRADMVCAMDWTYVGADPTFYDVWVSRTLVSGDSFFNIPPDGNWDSAWNLFWNEPDARMRYHAHQAFQVFSCWNGATVFLAAPVLSGQVRFRAPSQEKGECFQGEPQLFCKDLWRTGHGRIAVVPSVNLEYSNAQARRIKELKGYATRWVEDEEKQEGAKERSRIEWRADPPAKVKCMPSYENQTWVPWDEGFS